MQNYILYLAYNNIDNINECKFSLLRYFGKYNNIPPAGISIVIYTDQPDLFKQYTLFFDGIVIKELSKEKMKEWRGDDNYFFRIKAKMIEDFFSSHTGNFLFCDTDTYILAPLNEIFDNIEKGEIYMHQMEGLLGDKTNKYLQKWDKFMSRNPIDYNNKNFIYSPDIQVWNSGIVGMNSQYGFLLNDYVSLADNIYKKFPKHIAEQFALGYCLQKVKKINDAEKLVAHYWFLKEARILLKDFFDSYKDSSIPELVKHAESFDMMQMMEEKKKFTKLNWFKKKCRSIKGDKWSIHNYYKL